jgi:predicted RNA methylase
MTKTIYDIGMHSGRDTGFYLKKGFKVVAIEADPKHVQNGKEKFKSEIEP